MLPTQAFSTLLRTAAQKAISSRGVEGSGAFNLYKVLSDEDRMFGSDRADFVEFITSRVDSSRIIHEIGDGAGLLSLALFDAGYDCVNFCANGQRSRFSESLARAVKANIVEREGAAKRYRILKDCFPSHLTGHLLTQETDAVFISFDSINDQFSNNEVNVLKRMSEYKDVFLNLNRFLSKRTTPEEQSNPLLRLESLGMTVRHLDPVGSSSRNVWLSKD